MTNPVTPTPDQQAAHHFLSELRTRISTQPLYYQQGVEQRALESLYEVFVHAREAMKKFPGCETFARDTTAMLNVTLRPFTAKWHRAQEEGRLLSRDGGDEFRAELAELQKDLRGFAKQLGQMAYGAPVEDEASRPPISPEELALCMADLAYGIPADPMTNGGITARVDDINTSEGACVAARRARTGCKRANGTNAVGLAFSGGGIRSATLCLGVAQVLADKELLHDVDFLSTVSGGGYTGSFLSKELAHGTPQAQLAGPHGPDPLPIQTLRRQAKYLVGRSNWDSWNMVVQTVVGMLVNWCGPLLFVAVATAVAIVWKRQVPGTEHWLLVAWIALAATMAAGVLFFWFERHKSPLATRAGWAMGVLAIAFFGGLAVWLFDNGFYWLLPQLRDQRAHWTMAQLGAAVQARFAAGNGSSWLTIGFLSTTIPAVLRFVPWLERPLVRKIVTTIALLLAGLIVPALAVACAYTMFALGCLDDLGTCPLPNGLLGLIGAALVLTAIVLVVNVNTTGPHRLYRRGLTRTFVDGIAKRPPPFLLTALGDEAPYHLLNATVNLPASEALQLRERRADFFVFSKHWIGSPAIGYSATHTWRMDGQPPDLGTAMAISGAAFSPNMGLGSFPTLRAMLTLLNVRLGYWIRRPGKRGLFRQPGAMCLLREMTSKWMDERHRWLNLSDGGHIENLGMYELLRRRCKFIVCVDGEADPGHSFQGLLTVVRHAQIDFGVEIDTDLRDLRPDPATGCTRSHYHFCRIRYPKTAAGAQQTGLLLYVKLSVTGNEPELIARYRANHPTFPHQTTLDQFFDEEQFEAYRQLGVHIAEGLFKRAVLSDQAHARATAKIQPRSFEDWFRRLAKNLLPA